MTFFHNDSDFLLYSSFLSSFDDDADDADDDDNADDADEDDDCSTHSHCRRLQAWSRCCRCCFFFFFFLTFCILLLLCIPILLLLFGMARFRFPFRFDLHDSLLHDVWSS